MLQALPFRGGLRSYRFGCVCHWLLFSSPAAPPARSDPFLVSPLFNSTVLFKCQSKFVFPVRKHPLLFAFLFLIACGLRDSNSHRKLNCIPKKRHRHTHKPCQQTRPCLHTPSPTTQLHSAELANVDAPGLGMTGCCGGPVT